MTDISSKSEQAVEKALSTFKVNGPTPDRRGMHEMVAEVEEMANELLRNILAIKKRLIELDNFQSRFYGGQPR